MRRAVRLVGACALASLAGCAAGRFAPGAYPGAGGVTLPPCPGDGVTISDGQSTDCDLTPPQTLTIVVSGDTWDGHQGTVGHAGWGGDASLRWAHDELADAGCAHVATVGDEVVGTECDY